MTAPEYETVVSTRKAILSTIKRVESFERRELWEAIDCLDAWLARYADQVPGTVTEVTV